MELLERGLDPCIKDEKGRTPYMLAHEQEVTNIFRRFMASNHEKWDWQAAKVPSALTEEMEDSHTAKQTKKLSEFDELNKEQEVTFMNYLSAAEELIEHLKSENDQLHEQVDELRNEVASIRLFLHFNLD